MDSAKTQIGADEEQFTEELRPGTKLLQGQYVIENFINSGGFGMTYLARNSLDRKVVVKECFPANFCARNGDAVHARSRDQHKEFKSIVRLFVQEAHRLSRLSHPNIVGVHEVFEDNETAYMVLDFVDGPDLLDIVDDEKRELTPDELLSMLLKILDAVSYMHDEDVLHRDISPDNIILEKTGNPILIDFGAAREKATKASRALSALLVVKDGYSPQEFYLAGSKQGPPSDLYALGATFYHMVVGHAPPNSQTRLAAIAAKRDDPYKPISGQAPGYDKNFLAAIDRALNVFPQDRIQNAREWSTEIDIEKRRAKALALARRDKHIDRSISILVNETNKAVFADSLKAPKKNKKKALPAFITEQDQLKKIKSKPILLLHPVYVKPDPNAEPEPEPEQPEAELEQPDVEQDLSEAAPETVLAMEQNETDVAPLGEPETTETSEPPETPAEPQDKVTSRIFKRSGRRSYGLRFWATGKSRTDNFGKAGL